MTIRLMFLLIVCISISKGKAQTIEDALRYSSESLNGTARFNALSGAFGALGADVSSIAINQQPVQFLLKVPAQQLFQYSTTKTTLIILVQLPRLHIPIQSLIKPVLFFHQTIEIKNL